MIALTGSLSSSCESLWTNEDSKWSVTLRKQEGKSSFEDSLDSSKLQFSCGLGAGKMSSWDTGEGTLGYFVFWSWWKTWYSNRAKLTISWMIFLFSPNQWYCKRHWRMCPSSQRELLPQRVPHLCGAHVLSWTPTFTPKYNGVPFCRSCWFFPLSF